jgi:hypothetical protein
MNVTRPKPKPNSLLCVYALRFEDGTWFKKGWTPQTPDVNEARLFTKIGQARAQNTKMKGIAEIVPFLSTPQTPLTDESARVEKALLKKSTAKLEEKRRSDRRRLKDLEAPLTTTEAEIRRLRGT